MADHRMARADLATGALLFVLAVAVIYGSWTMDRLEIRQIHPLSVPGLTPGLLGIALGLASVLLIVRATGILRRPAAGDAEEGSDRGSTERLLGVIAVCLVYALGLVGRMPFWLATAIFVAAFIAIFEWDRGGPPARRYARLAWALFLGVATGIAVTYVFRDLFLVRLP
ncbi:tripartite tricarboxylate transporter TctB family protein [Inquilinus sp. CAU 1745]|uniref:tripartite tricarboxylate transporter TctB family protein n=1 Tax=Inquilinus sp. CAU 1745 TaxID=3140369 RepID=UPI00325B130A